MALRPAYLALGLAALGLTGCLDATPQDVAIEAQTTTYAESDGAWTAKFYPVTDNAVTYETDARGVVVNRLSTLAEGLGIGQQTLVVSRDPALTVEDRARAGDIALEVCLGQGRSISAEAMARSVFEAGTAEWIFQEICI